MLRKKVYVQDEPKHCDYLLKVLVPMCLQNNSLKGYGAMITLTTVTYVVEVLQSKLFDSIHSVNVQWDWDLESLVTKEMKSSSCFWNHTLTSHAMWQGTLSCWNMPLPSNETYYKGKTGGNFHVNDRTQWFEAECCPNHHITSTKLFYHSTFWFHCFSRTMCSAINLIQERVKIHLKILVQ